jgi:hypothetical protein
MEADIDQTNLKDFVFSAQSSYNSLFDIQVKNHAVKSQNKEYFLIFFQFYTLIGSEKMSFEDFIDIESICLFTHSIRAFLSELPKKKR